MGSSVPFVRPYRSTDFGEIEKHKRICNRGIEVTNGERSLSQEELDAPATPTEDALWRIYCHAYLMLEPEGVFVIDDGDGKAVGHIVTTCDSKTFGDRYERDYLPRLDYPAPDEPAFTSLSEGERDAIMRMYNAPSRTMRPQLDLDRYPAHLHMGIAPEWQSQKLGPKLLQAAERRWREHGIQGPANPRSRQFYVSHGWRPTSDANLLKDLE